MRMTSEIALACASDDGVRSLGATPASCITSLATPSLVRMILGISDPLRAGISAITQGASWKMPWANELQTAQNKRHTDPLAEMISRSAGVRFKCDEAVHAICYTEMPQHVHKAEQRASASGTAYANFASSDHAYTATQADVDKEEQRASASNAIR